MKLTDVMDEPPNWKSRVRVLETRVGFLTAGLNKEIYLRRMTWFCVFLYAMFRWIYG